MFPGTFDPMTNGHLDVIRRGAGLFDELIVAVGNNPEKACLLNQDERAEIVRQAVADIPNVRVETYEGLTVDCARRLGISTFLRGLRGFADLHFEYQVAMTNREVAGIETLFMLSSGEHAFASSTLIKQMAEQGADVSEMVPPPVLRHLKRRFGPPR